MRNSQQPGESRWSQFSFGGAFSVAQIGNLPHRRFPICGPLRWLRRSTLGRAAAHRPELLLFLTLLLIFNAPLLAACFSHSLTFEPQAVRNGEWWRLFTHPFVHVSWYHLLLDGTAFLALYSSLAEKIIVRRLWYVFAGAAGSLLISWAAAPSLARTGLCGLSVAAHGLMAVSALELVAAFPARSPVHRLRL